MLVLRDMRQDEYPAYRRYFIEDYGREIVENYGHSEERAREQAERDLLRFLPRGPETPGHTLLCIDSPVDGRLRTVGYLWHSVNPSEASTFIYDFYVSGEYRGRGIGKAAISALEAQLKADGIGQIKLRVAYHNERALKLYRDAGFMITGLNMSKSI